MFLFNICVEFAADRYLHLFLHTRESINGIAFAQSDVVVEARICFLHGGRNSRKSLSWFYGAVQCC